MYEIKCRHETEGVPVSEVLNDHYPLTEGDVKRLLVKAAIVRSDVGRFSDIQCRLVQGIPGLVCPNKLTGRVSRKMFLLETAFQTVSPDNIDDLTSYIMNIYKSE